MHATVLEVYGRVPRVASGQTARPWGSANLQAGASSHPRRATLKLAKLDERRQSIGAEASGTKRLRPRGTGCRRIPL